ncbi:MAG: tetratricopeptide repeat protein [Archangium sp.]
MRRLTALLLALLAFSCEEPERAATRQKVQTTIDHVAQGRLELSNGRPEAAIKEFKAAISTTPEDASLYLQLAEAYRMSGNEAGATLTLKQAESVSGIADPSIRRQRADLLRRMHQTRAAIAELKSLRDEDLLTDEELLDLSRLLAHAGKIDEAFHTIEKIQERSPDDPDAKTMEAEILFLKGDVVLAARLMDRLIAENPRLTAPRMLRARYFLNEKQSASAEQDLQFIDARDAKRADVLSLKARVLNELGRVDEAASLVEHVVEDDPKDADALALLAEIRLLQDRGGDAQVLIERILAMEPSWPRAIYVRGRAYEQQGRFEEALSDYQLALKNDGNFAPALTRIWRVYDKLGNKPDAISALEQLYFTNESTLDEKVQLARYYADTWANVDRGEKIINEVLKKDPKNPDYLAIKKALAKGTVKKKKPGIQIIRGR